MKTHIVIAMLALAMLALPTVSAQASCDSSAQSLCDKVKSGTDKMVKTIQFVAGPILALVAIGSAFAWGFGAGNERTRSTAKAGFLGALGGLVLVLLAKPIVDAVQSIFS